MAFEKSKVLKSAEKFVAAGKIANAIDEYEKILKENPKEWNIMIQIGDLLLKVNRSDEAIDYFRKVAEHYHQDGFFLKAIAIYKRINKLDPSLTEICLKLAELYLRQGLPMDAKSQLQTVAHHHISRNENKEAIEILKQLIEIEPDNLRTRHELAKTYKNEGMIPEAIQEYMEINDHLLRKNLLKESVTVLETAYRLDPKNVEVLRKILTLHSEQNESEKALVFMEESLKEDPGNPELLGLISEAYAAKGDLPKAHKMVDQAMKETEDERSYRELKGDLYLRSEDLGQAFEQYLFVVDQEIQNREVTASLNLLERVTKMDPAFHPAWEKYIELYSLLRQTANMHAAYGSLADAYIAKEMYQEAAESLEKLIELDPDDHQHQEKLTFVRSRLKAGVQGEVAEKVKESPAAQERKAPLSADTLPGFPDLELHLKKTAPSAVIEKRAPAKAKIAVPSARVETATSQENEFVSEHLIEADVFNKYGLIDKAIEQLRHILEKYPNSVPARQKLKEVHLERGERDFAVKECIAMSRILRGRGENEQAEDLLSEARQIDPNSPDLETAYEELTLQPGEAVELEEPQADSVLKTTEEKEEPAITIEIPEESVPEIEVAPPVPKPERKAAKPAKKLRKSSPDLRADELLGEIERFAHSIKTQSGSFRARPTKPPEPTPQPPDIESIAEEVEVEIEVEKPVEPAAEPASAEDVSALPLSEFEEIDFYISQDMLEDARNLLEKLKAEHPGDSGIASRMERIDVMVQSGAAKQEEPVVVPVEEEIEIIMDEAPETPSVAEDIPVPGEVTIDEIPEVSIDTEAPEVEAIPEVAELPEIVGSEQPEMAKTPEFELDEEFVLDQPKEEPQPVTEESPALDEDVSTESAERELDLEMEFGELEDTGTPELEETIEVEQEVSAVEFDTDLDRDLSDALDAAFVVEEVTEPEKAKEPEPEPESEPTRLKEELFEEEDDFFDLAAELEEGLLNVQSAVEEERPPDGQNYSLEEILTDFKKGVDKQLGTEDYDTRYNLGIAYKEMGLVDEAIAEFQIAAKEPKRFLECCSMLGLCFAEKGMPKLAMKWYQKGLGTPGYSEDEFQGLKFDLAQIHEGLGDTEKALEIFQEVYGVNANYRNVSKKIKELQGSSKES